MNRAFIRGLLCEFEKHAKKRAKQPEQPQMQMMPAIPPEVLAALMGQPEPEYEEPSMLQMMTPSVGLGAAGLGVAAAGGLGWPRIAPHLSALKKNLAARAAPMMARMNPMRFFRKGASEAFVLGFFDELAKTGRVREEEREDPPGALGLVLKLMRRLGKGSDSTTVRAFQDLATNIPTNKRPY